MAGPNNAGVLWEWEMECREQDLEECWSSYGDCNLWQVHPTLRASFSQAAAALCPVHRRAGGRMLRSGGLEGAATVYRPFLPSKALPCPASPGDSGRALR